MSIETVLADLEKKFGAEVVMKYGSKPKVKPEVISTTLPSLDKALGIGGLPYGRIVEVYGPESSGKTTLALTVMAQVQKEGKNVAFVDAEHALDPIYAQNLGVDMDNVIISQPDCGEQALEVVETLVKSGEVSLIVVDSVAALTPKSVIDGEMENQNVGVHAKLMSKALSKLASISAKNNCTIIFINQLREKIGVTWGSPETTTGGKALKFYSSIRIDIRRIASIKNGEENIGNRTRIKVIKNKLAAPHKETEFDIMFGKGISVAGEVLDNAVNKGVITKKGAWFAFEGNNFAQGREKARLFLEDPEFLEKVQKSMAALTEGR